MNPTPLTVTRWFCTGVQFGMKYQGNIINFSWDSNRDLTKEMLSLERKSDYRDPESGIHELIFFLFTAFSNASKLQQISSEDNAVSNYGFQYDYELRAITYSLVTSTCQCVKYLRFIEPNSYALLNQKHEDKINALMSLRNSLEHSTDKNRAKKAVERMNNIYGNTIESDNSSINLDDILDILKDIQESL
jgi:hypothetical protein